MRLALALVLASACTATTWTRTIVVEHTEHVQLALDTDEHRACFARCAQQEPASACLRACDGAVVEPGACHIGRPDEICEVTTTADAPVHEPGRCGEWFSPVPGATLGSCRDRKDVHTTAGGYVAGVGAIFAVGVVALVVYVLGTRPGLAGH